MGLSVRRALSQIGVGIVPMISSLLKRPSLTKWDLLGIAGLSLYIGFLMNLCVPVLRLASPRMNTLFLIGMQCIPVIFLLVRRRRKYESLLSSVVLMTVVVFTVGFLALGVLGLMRTENDREIQAVQFGPSRLVLFRTRGGVRMPPVGHLRQERNMLGPLLLVRDLDHFGGPKQVTLIKVDDTRVRLELLEFHYDLGYRQIDREYTVRPWVYF